MIKSIKVLSYIDRTYTGGMEQFQKDGGAVCYLPEPTDIVYVIHPNLPEAMKNNLVGMYGPSIKFGTKWNFEGASEEQYREIQNVLDDILNQLNLGPVGTSVNPAVLIIAAPNLTKDDKRIEKLVKIISTMPSVERGCIICKNGYVPFDGTASDKPFGDFDKIGDILDTGIPIPEETPAASPSHPITSVSVTGRPKRNKVIGSDDILNLKIALETASTLEEFLQQV